MLLLELLRRAVLRLRLLLLHRRTILRRRAVLLLLRRAVLRRIILRWRAVLLLRRRSILRRRAILRWRAILRLLGGGAGRGRLLRQSSLLLSPRLLTRHATRWRCHARLLARLRPSLIFTPARGDEATRTVHGPLHLHEGESGLHAHWRSPDHLYRGEGQVRHVGWRPREVGTTFFPVETDSSMRFEFRRFVVCRDKTACLQTTAMHGHGFVFVVIV
jgi:hypothetical protein